MLSTFPLGSSGRPDGVTPQHIRDLLQEARDDSLQQALVDFVNLILAEAFNKEVNFVIFGARLIALSKRWGRTNQCGPPHSKKADSQMCQQLHFKAA